MNKIKGSRRSLQVICICTGIVSSLPLAPAALAARAPAAAAAVVTVFAEGLNNPRGLKFGPDGNL